MERKDMQHLTNDDISVVCDTFTATIGSALKTIEEMDKRITSQLKLILAMGILLIIGLVSILTFIIVITLIPIG